MYREKLIMDSTPGPMPSPAYESYVPTPSTIVGESDSAQELHSPDGTHNLIVPPRWRAYIPDPMNESFYILDMPKALVNAPGSSFVVDVVKPLVSAGSSEPTFEEAAQKMYDEYLHSTSNGGDDDPYFVRKDVIRAKNVQGVVYTTRFRKSDATQKEYYFALETPRELLQFKIYSSESAVLKEVESVIKTLEIL